MLDDGLLAEPDDGNRADAGSGEMILGWCYVLTLAITSVLSLRTGLWLTIALLPPAIQSVLIMASAGGEQRLREAWMPVEIAVVAFAMISITCAFLYETGPIVPYRRFWLRTGAVAVSAALVGMVWVGIHHEDPYWIFLALRSRLWQSAALVLFITWVMVPHRVHGDTMLLFFIAAAHALVGPLAGQHVAWAQPTFRLIVMAACLHWIVRGESRQDRPAVRV